MRRLFLIIALCCVAGVAQAGQTLRVGQQVLTVGDTAVHVLQLLGTPVLKEPVQNRFGAYQGQRWEYPREHGHVIVVTVINGRVASIDEQAS